MISSHLNILWLLIYINTLGNRDVSEIYLGRGGVYCNAQYCYFFLYFCWSLYVNFFWGGGGERKYPFSENTPGIIFTKSSDCWILSGSWLRACIKGREKHIEIKEMFLWEENADLSVFVVSTYSGSRAPLPLPINIRKII